jgi:hypothetical protein
LSCCSSADQDKLVESIHALEVPNSISRAKVLGCSRSMIFQTIRTPRHLPDFRLLARSQLSRMRDIRPP